MEEAAQSKQIIEFLSSKWFGQKVCVICGLNNWNVHAKPLQLTEFNRGALLLGGPVIPVVAVTCMNCGNTHLFNAILLGAVQREPVEAPKAPQGSTTETQAGVTTLKEVANG